MPAADENMKSHKVALNIKMTLNVFLFFSNTWSYSFLILELARDWPDLNPKMYFNHIMTKFIWIKCGTTYPMFLPKLIHYSLRKHIPSN